MAYGQYSRYAVMPYDGPRASTPVKEIGSGEQCMDISEIFKNLSVEGILGNCDSAFSTDSDPDLNDFETAAIYEFIQSKRKTKYLYDGVNMIKLRPQKNAAIKAVLGRAYYLKNLLADKFQSRRGGLKASKSLSAKTTTAVAVAGAQKLAITDYVPSEGLQVPEIIQNICFEIEYRAKAACEEGTYRMSGGDIEIKALKAKFLANQNPCLANEDVHTLTGCLKSFLRGLREPIIPNIMWKDFVDAATIKCEDLRDQQIQQLVEYLPNANRETLAFLVAHLQRICACPDAKMPIPNMAIVFAPTLIGFSSTDDAQINMAESKIIIDTMDSILRVPADFWNGLLEKCNVLE